MDTTDAEFEEHPVSHAAYAHTPQRKIYNNQDIQKTVSQVKKAQDECTPKANASSLPDPAPTPASDDLPTVQSGVYAAESVHTSRQNLPTTMPSTVSRLAQDDIPAAENPPAINVTPASPLTLPSASRPVDPLEALTSAAGSPPRSTRESASDRRASRRRSGMDVCIFFLRTLSLVLTIYCFPGQSPSIGIFLQFIASPRTGRGTGFIEPPLNSCGTTLTFIARSRCQPQSSPCRTIAAFPASSNLD